MIRKMDTGFSVPNHVSDGDSRPPSRTGILGIRIAGETVSPMTHRTSTRTDRDSAASVLAALADADSVAILSAAADEYRSVSELVDRCSLPTSTTYRKVHELVDAGLLDERVRVRSSAPNAAEYGLRPVSVEVEITPEDGLSVALADGSADRRLPVDDPVVRALVNTDGAEETVVGAPGDR